MPTNTDASEFNLRTNLDSYHSRLKWARKRAHLKQEQVCALVSMSQGAYSLLETRGNGSEKTASLAKVLQVDPVWLETGQGVPDLPASPSETYVEIRVVELKVQAGTRGFEVESAGEGVEPIMFRRSWLSLKGYKPERLFGVRIKQPDMVSALFVDDLVILNTADTELVDGEVYAVNHEGDALIRRVVRDSGQWWLYSDNPDKSRFPKKSLSDESAVVGRIVLKQSERI